ncbi:bifunctional DNA primase/polymerase [Myceligenerans pegani]|uniref:Bifunctional DNA primase/polymerase n=1 Tax=Myceligenerans pegani TaxID=2776917 RepID=A0ABR9N5R3_9MICO|nr:bifunctional DNA primase/polymerase [Myceligenerans sp. TRM 65318]MBE1878989.1 bifunctional DNA primase/polymerase [Myceligenerans sp. TRM 65318]MBE3021260.1 bifunctional DNA primase/polymerase [Myceligenerans sp. TRM 65318]
MDPRNEQAPVPVAVPGGMSARLEAVAAAFTAPTPGATAVRLAGAGVAVFPCWPGGKTPLTKRAFKDATSDPARVAGIWRSWPRANVGVPTGWVSGLDVVDVDVHADGDGWAAFDRTLRAGLTAGWAFTVRTPRGGLHAYFPNPGIAENRCWSLSGAHVDFRSNGGYVVVPPSHVTYPDENLWQDSGPEAGQPGPGGGGFSGTYVLERVAGHAVTPVDGPGLRDFLAPPRSPQRSWLAWAGDGARRSRSPERLAAWLASQPGSGRHLRMFWAACRLAESGHDLQVALATIGRASVQVGVSEREARRQIGNAYRLAGNHPRAGPARPSVPDAGVPDSPTGGDRRPSRPDSPGR